MRILIVWSSSSCHLHHPLFLPAIKFTSYINLCIWIIFAVLVSIVKYILSFWNDLWFNWRVNFLYERYVLKNWLSMCSSFWTAKGFLYWISRASNERWRLAKAIRCSLWKTWRLKCFVNYNTAWPKWAFFKFFFILKFLFFWFHLVQIKSTHTFVLWWAQIDFVKFSFCLFWFHFYYKKKPITTYT